MQKNFTITAHCIVKDEENFIRYAVKSVIDYIDKMIIFDTGSSDRTAQIAKELADEYPGKILLEKKGECDRKRHTELRQEMVERTDTEWFVVLDGDEIWTSRAMEEAVNTINENKNVECLIAPFFLCIGDVYHKYYKSGVYEILGKKGNHTPRFFKKIDIFWRGEYGADYISDRKGNKFFRQSNSIFLKNKFWHLSHLKRSPLDDADYSSGSNRAEKRRLTHFFIGRKINEPLPEIFDEEFLKSARLGFFQSCVNFIIYIKNKFYSVREDAKHIR